MMRAVQYLAYGDYEENKLVELPPPQIAEDEVLIEMRTVGINPLDNTFRSGHFHGATPESLPRIGGQTGVGVVLESKSPTFEPGDRVFVTGEGYGLVADGTWRDLVAAPAAALTRIPLHIDDDYAAAFLAGAGYLTAYLALTEFARFKRGQTILAPGIGCAMGMESVQIARRLGASLTISTASTTRKAVQAHAAGYPHVIDLSREGLREGVLRLTGGKGVDVVIDGIGDTLTKEALGSLAVGGMLVVVGGYAGGRETTLDLTEIIEKSAQIRGFTFRHFAPETIQAAQKTLLGFLSEGSLRPMIAKVFPLSEAAEAVRHLIEDQPLGRVLMRTTS